MSFYQMMHPPEVECLAWEARQDIQELYGMTWGTITRDQPDAIAIGTEYFSWLDKELKIHYAHGERPKFKLIQIPGLRVTEFGNGEFKVCWSNS